MPSTLSKTIITSLFLFFTTFIYCQEESEATGMPGDHFSLEGTLEMFKKANSIEEFEKLINEKNNSINNLDLNEDGDVDYIMVNDNQEKDAHALVLQIAISEKENQDIAVIEIEKTENENAILQIIGDEEIFGEEIIIEASDGNEEEVEEYTPSNKGPNANYDAPSNFVVVNVWTWPAVRFVYAPLYRPYRSAWYWKHYPNWYKPWRPLAWTIFHPFALKHRHVGFRTVHTHRVLVAHRVYTPHRTTSITVKTRFAGPKSNYKVTSTTRKTTVKGPRGNTHSVKQKSTKVKSRKRN